jgi:hypothetical protein
MRYLIWLLAFSLTLPACAQKTKLRKTKAAVSTPKPAAQVTATEPVLVVQRTPCHGTCPTYTATIYADGRVEYDGQRFVSLLGKHTLSLPVATVNQMLAEAKRIGFTKLRDRYAGDTYDLPSTIITVHPVGQPAKEVYAMQDIPENLQGYIDYLNKRLDPLANNVQDK